MPRGTHWIAFIAVLCIVSGCRVEEDRGPATQPPDGSASEIDRLRSLPYAGFTDEAVDEGRQGVVAYDKERSYPGYNLASLHTLCSAELIDAAGKVLHSWQRAGCRRWANTLLLTNGDLLVVGADGSVPGKKTFIRNADRYLQRLAWQSEPIWERRITAHHDLQITPSGEILVLTMADKLIPKIQQPGKTRDNLLTLLTPGGDFISQHSLYEVMNTDADVFRLQPVVPQEKRPTPFVDLFHSNSVDWMRHKHLEAKDPIYAADNVLVSIRHQDTVAIINWERRKVVWAWGQGEISGPHDATVLESGNILLFDNGLGREWSRVIEVDPLSRRIVWQYKAPRPEDFYSESWGAAQRLPNGNTLITNSGKGQAFEVTKDGEIVWEYLNPHLSREGRRAVIGWMRRYELDYVDGILEAIGEAG